MKARPIISFFRTWAAPLLTVFGALIFELTKITFPHIPGQLSVQDIIRQLWDALSNARSTRFAGLIRLFTSIPVERFHQALQVLLHQYDLKVGLQNVSHWSVFEIKSEYRKRIFKGKWGRMTKIPRVLHAEDLQILLDSVIANSHFEINGYLFRQARGVAMGSPAAPFRSHRGGLLLASNYDFLTAPPARFCHGHRDPGESFVELSLGFNSALGFKR